MPHRVVDKKVIENIDREISNRLQAIRLTKELQAELSRPAIKDFVESLKKQMNSYRVEKDSCLIQATDQSFRQASFILGRETMAKEIIDSFEGTDSLVKYHQAEVTELEKKKEEYSKLVEDND